MNQLIIDDPAFPGQNNVTFKGISSRDYFAAIALGALVSSAGGLAGPQEIADRAYDLADAMMAERRQRGRVPL